MKFKSTYPPHNEIDGLVVSYLENGLNEFRKLFKDKFNLRNYTVGIDDFSDPHNYYSVSFMPNVESMFEDINFEIADKGMYKNGMGVVFFFSSKEDKLLKTVYMR